MTRRLRQEIADYELARQESDDPGRFPRVAFGLVLICPRCGKVSPPLDRGTGWAVWERHYAQHTDPTGRANDPGGAV